VLCDALAQNGGDVMHRLLVLFGLLFGETTFTGAGATENEGFHNFKFLLGFFRKRWDCNAMLGCRLLLKKTVLNSIYPIFKTNVLFYILIQVSFLLTGDCRWYLLNEVEFKDE